MQTRVSERPGKRPSLQGPGPPFAGCGLRIGPSFRVQSPVLESLIKPRGGQDTGSARVTRVLCGGWGQGLGAEPGDRRFPLHLDSTGLAPGSPLPTCLSSMRPVPATCPHQLHTARPGLQQGRGFGVSALKDWVLVPW